MAKNIVICADGTGNSTIKGRGTNVFKLYEAVDENGHRFDPTLTQQVAMYHDGVGTESLKWLRAFGGATGWGLSRNVKQLYGELARVYDPGDHIFLFGFSRGAFTVRTLGGLITTCGILDIAKYPTNAAFDAAVHSAYREYRRKYQTALSRLLRGKVTLDAAALRRQFSVAIPAFADSAEPVIDFIGVWDTVDAVGLPLSVADVINEVFVSIQVSGCHVERASWARLPRPCARRGTRELHTGPLAGDRAGGRQTPRTSVVRWRPFQRGRRLPPAGHVARVPRLDDDEGRNPRVALSACRSPTVSGRR